MPANLSPAYREAQEAYRRAEGPKERLDCLREMLRAMPKHKGTEHLQADLRTRIRELTDELAAPRKAGARAGPVHTVRPEGAAQVALVGPPNVGKSALHHRLTGSHAVVGPYPYATRAPLPGMLPCRDTHIQLVDLPAVAADFLEPWMGNALQNAEGALLVIDLADPGCLEQADAVRRRLAEKHVTLLGTGPADGARETPFDDDPFGVRLNTVLVANKCDRLADPRAELETFRQLSGFPCPALAASAESGVGLDAIGEALFVALGIIRVYTKLPGHAADTGRPFTLRSGATVRDVARLVHRGRAEELRHARLWGSGEFDGQQVSPEHPVADGDTVELHW